MIENIRKYTGLMAVVFVLLGAGFLFTMGPGRGGGGMTSGPVMLEVNGYALDQTSYQRMGSSTLQLASETGLHSYINFLMAPDAAQLQQSIQLGRYGYNYYTMMRGNMTNQDLNRFIANRLILQNAMTTMGIYASEEKITETLKKSPIFAPKGKYDQAAYSLFVDKRLGRLGMTEKDLRALIRESLCLNKLVAIVGGGLTPSRTAIQDLLDAQNQTVTLTEIVLNRDDFVEKEKPTEEEIKAYWESHQDAYKTEEQRRISYILIDLPKELKDKKDTSAKTDKEKAAETKTSAEKAEKIRLATRDLAKEIQATYQDILDSESQKKPLDLKAIATARNHTLVQTKLFTKTSLPKELAGFHLRGSSNRNRAISEDIFNITNAKNDYDRVSPPLPVGEHAYIIFLLDEVIEPVLLDYAAAHDKARAKLIGENATKKVKQAAKDQRTAILELMKAGKSFDEAAKEKGLTPVQVGPYSLHGTLPKNEPSARQLHTMASGLNPGDVSKTIDENDRSLFFYLVKRELEDTEANKLQLDRAMDGSKSELMIRTYLSWIQNEYDNADVKGIATEQQ
jgi:hypothetical protein